MRRDLRTSSKKAVFVLALLLAVETAVSAQWTAVDEIPFGNSNSLSWCIENAAEGDTVNLEEGLHFGPILLKENMVLFGPSSGIASIQSISTPVEMVGFVGIIERVTLDCVNPRSPVMLLRVEDSEAILDSITFLSATLGGNTITMMGSSELTITRSDFSISPRSFSIELMDCPNDVNAWNCTWPTTDSAFVERLIWDKLDAGSLGRVNRN